MKRALEAELQEFASEHNFKGKGKLSVALVVTQHARDRGLPLDPDHLLTEGGGQVAGLGMAAVQNILSRHGVDRILAKEGGRTSRGSIKTMQAYVEFLNHAYNSGMLRKDDLGNVETFWVARIKDYFAGKPFKFRLDAGKGIRAAVADLIDQAKERQAESMGMMYVGAVMQHLVGAKLQLALPAARITHNSFSTSDEQSGRIGDFQLGDTAIHVTVTPSDALIRRCEDNIHSGKRPIIVTSKDGVVAASVLAAGRGISDAIDVFEIEQFIALNLYELSAFESTSRSPTASDLIELYNKIVDEHETDPSLSISL